MDAPLGLDEVCPRTAVVVGIFSAVVFGATIVPEPIVFVQVVAALATIGSFGLAILNHTARSSDVTEQSVEVHGDGPVTVVQAGESTYGFTLSHERDEWDEQSEDREELVSESERD